MQVLLNETFVTQKIAFIHTCTDCTARNKILKLSKKYLYELSRVQRNALYTGMLHKNYTFFCV